MAVAYRLDQAVWSAWLQAAWQPTQLGAVIWSARSKRLMPGRCWRGAIR
jgi:hypothetical protein